MVLVHNIPSQPRVLSYQVSSIYLKLKGVGVFTIPGFLLANTAMRDNSNNAAPRFVVLVPNVSSQSHLQFY